MNAMRRHKVKVIVAANAKGRILKANSPLSFLGGVDPATGVVVDESHPLCGKTVHGTMLVIPRGKGSTVGSYVLYSLATCNAAPAAIIMKEMDMIVATGCVLGGIPLAIAHAEVWDTLKDGLTAELDPESSSLGVSE